MKINHFIHFSSDKFKSSCVWTHLTSFPSSLHHDLMILRFINIYFEFEIKNKQQRIQRYIIWNWWISTGNNNKSFIRSFRTSKSCYSLLSFETEQREIERGGKTRDELKNIDAYITINIHKRLKKFYHFARVSLKINWKRLKRREETNYHTC